MTIKIIQMEFLNYPDPEFIMEVFIYVWEQSVSIFFFSEKNSSKCKKSFAKFFMIFSYFSVFGIGSMIYSGIEIGMFFELNMGKNAKCSNLFSVIRPLLQMIFVFVQMYFIFLNQKMNIYKNRFLSRFGLMHMIATNLCVWLNVLILETNHEIVDLHLNSHHDRRDAHSSTYQETKACRQTGITLWS